MRHILRTLPYGSSGNTTKRQRPNNSVKSPASPLCHKIRPRSLPLLLLHCPLVAMWRNFQYKNDRITTCVAGTPGVIVEPCGGVVGSSTKHQWCRVPTWGPQWRLYPNPFIIKCWSYHTTTTTTTTKSHELNWKIMILSIILILGTTLHLFLFKCSHHPLTR